MLQAALRSGAAQRRCVFEVFARRLPRGPPVRRRGRHRPPARGRPRPSASATDELAALRERGVVDEPTLDCLAGYRFTGDDLGLRRGRVLLPRVAARSWSRAPSPRRVLLETLVLSILNHDSAVAAAASPDDHRRRRPPLHRDGLAPHPRAGGGRRRPRGLRRRVRRHQQPRGRARRTACRPPAPRAHAFTLLHDDERAAFEAQVACLGTGTTLLVDTYDVPDRGRGRGRGRRARAGRRAAGLRRPAHPGRRGPGPAGRPGRHRAPGSW